VSRPPPWAWDTPFLDPGFDDEGWDVEFVISLKEGKSVPAISTEEATGTAISSCEAYLAERRAIRRRAAAAAAEKAKWDAIWAEDRRRIDEFYKEEHRARQEAAALAAAEAEARREQKTHERLEAESAASAAFLRERQIILSRAWHHCGVAATLRTAGETYRLSCRVCGHVAFVEHSRLVAAIEEHDGRRERTFFLNELKDPSDPAPKGS
jgi:hypothetical protein